MIYCPRNFRILNRNSALVTINSKPHTINEVLDSDWRVATLLGEPGAGKTSCIDSIVRHHDAVKYSAYEVLNADVLSEKHAFILIDGFDELLDTYQNALGLREILRKMPASPNIRVIIASRASEWDESHNRVVQELDSKSACYTLEALSDIDRHQIAADIQPDVDFATFREALEMNSLWDLTGNPQLLRIFLKAFASAPQFNSKHDAFLLAVEKMGHELKNGEAKPLVTPWDERRTLVEDLCAILQLSGTEGLTMPGGEASVHFPAITDVVRFSAKHEIFRTALFSPGSSIGSLRPVHRTIAEFCAAHSLVRNINEAHNPSGVFSEILSIMAPDGFAKPSLRGTLAWMASVGSGLIREKVSDLVPYAILVDGDTTSFTTSQKRKLFEALVSTSKMNPYFRSMDGWRKPPTVNLQLSQHADLIRSALICPEAQTTHLPELLLELLENEAERTWINAELTTLVTSVNRHQRIRRHALELLFSSNADTVPQLFDHLLRSGTTECTRLAAECVLMRARALTNAQLLRFCEQAALIYSGTNNQHAAWDSKYFVKAALSSFSEEDAEVIIPNLIEKLPERHPHDQKSLFRLVGCSKVIAILIDRYIDVKKSSRIEVNKLFHWISPLRFFNKNNSAVSSSATNKLLRDSDDYRLEFWRYAGITCSDSEEFRNLFSSYHPCHHFGFTLYSKDIPPLLKTAAETGNPIIWESLYHRVWQQQRKPDERLSQARSAFRSLAHEHGGQMLQFWTKQEKSWRLEPRSSSIFGKKKYFRDKNESIEITSEVLRESNDESIITAVALAICGDTLDCGYHFQLFSLHQAFITSALRLLDRVKSVFNDEGLQQLFDECSNISIIVRALLELCESESIALSDIPKSALERVRLSNKASDQAIAQRGLKDLFGRVDILLFSCLKDRILFCKRIIEAQLRNSKEQIRFVDSIQDILGDDDCFGCLSVEWIKHSCIPMDHQEQVLFNVGLHSSRRSDLIHHIERQAQAYIELAADQDFEHSVESKTWLLRGLRYTSLQLECWLALSSIPNVVFDLNELDEFSGDDDGYTLETFPEDLRCKMLIDLIARWPFKKLPTSWGSGSPRDELGYRRVRKLLWSFTSAESSNTVLFLSELLENPCFEHELPAIKSIKARAAANVAHRTASIKTPQQIKRLLQEQEIIAVEQLKQVVLNELKTFENALHSHPLFKVDDFYYKTPDAY